jgi:hypothetical protein
MYIPPTCLGLKRPSSGKWLSKERVIMSNYVKDVQDIKIKIRVLNNLQAVLHVLPLPLLQHLFYTSLYIITKTVSELTRRINLRTILCLVLNELQLRQFYILVYDPWNVGIPLEHHVICRVRHCGRSYNVRKTA